MSDYIVLMGSEQVQRAGNDMRDAAARMAQAADYIAESASRMERIFAEALADLDRILGGER